MGHNGHDWATNTYGQSFENNILNIFYTINTYSFKIDERLEWKRYNTYKHFLNDEYLLLPSIGSDFLGYRKHLKFVYFMKSENFWSSNLLLLIVIT